MDVDDAALMEAREAVRTAPDYGDPYQVIGKVYAKRNNYRRAFENYRLAVIFAPSKKIYRYNLALSYYNLGDFEGAIKQYDVIRGMWPDDPRSYYLTAKCLVKNKQYDEAVRVVQKAYSFSRYDTQDVLHIGDVLFEQKEYEKAQRVYDLVLQDKDKFEAVHLKLGKTYQALGDVDRARKEYESALSRAPYNNEIKQALEDLSAPAAAH